MNTSLPPALSAVDAYAPREIAHRIETLGVTKAHSDTMSVLILAVLAGAFIALGALFFTVVVTRPVGSFGTTRLIGGVAFSLGLILVVVGGAELFTGNNLVAMAWASRRITSVELLRNWSLAYLGNALGALGTVGFVCLGRVHQLGDGAVGATAVAIGRHKAALGFIEAVALGVLCNALVCLAVWLAMGGRTVTDKVLAIVFPITAFVTIGLEHSIANMFFLPYAFVLQGLRDVPFLTGALHNLVAVTLGNLLGGTVLVAGVYWLAYLRGDRRLSSTAQEAPGTR
jgi:formate/nitrite transporter